MYTCEWYRNNGDCYINIPDSVYKCKRMGDKDSCTQFLFKSKDPYDVERKED